MRRIKTFTGGGHETGRHTYQGFAKAWPKMTGEFGEKMNSMPKYVVASQLNKVEWTGSKLIKGNVAEEVRELRRMPGRTSCWPAAVSSSTH